MTPPWQLRLSDTFPFSSFRHEGSGHCGPWHHRRYGVSLRQFSLGNDDALVPTIKTMPECGSDFANVLKFADVATWQTKHMWLRSSAFVDGAEIPRRFTCDGEDLSPPLQWGDFPAETLSFVLLCDDPDIIRGSVLWLGLWPTESARLDPMPTELVPGDDGLPAELVHDWVTERHAYLRSYVAICDVVRVKWRGPGPGPAFIDPFCSCGRSQVVETEAFVDGSPVVAWKASASGRKPFDAIYVADRDASRRSACELRLQRLGAPVAAVPGDALAAVRKIVPDIPRAPLHLAFLDPHSLGGLDFRLIQDRRPFSFGRRRRRGAQPLAIRFFRQ